MLGGFPASRLAQRMRVRGAHVVLAEAFASPDHVDELDVSRCG